LFDLNRDPRTVGLAYQHLVSLFEADLGKAPSIEAALEDASRITAREGRKLHA
jgi:hypothetical protein